MTQPKGSPKDSRYDAFISYRHRPMDQSVTEWLHKKLEAFRGPKGQGMPAKRKGFAVFIDKWELVGNPSLNQMIQAAARNADCFFLICSKTTPESTWIQEELTSFTSRHGWERVHPILIEGTPKESFPEEVFARKQRPYVDFLNLTADTATQVMAQLKREKLWYTSRLLGVGEEQLDSALRKRTLRRLATWGTAGALALALFSYGVTTFLRNAQQSRNAALASEQLAVKNEQLAEQSGREAALSEMQAIASRNAAYQSKQAANRSQRQAERSEQEALESEKDATQSRLAFDRELEKVEEAQQRHSENEVWAQIAQYEDDLRHYRALQARTYAEALAKREGITEAQQKALQAIVNASYGEGLIAPIYREEGLRFAAYSPDGKTLIIYGADGSLMSYEAASLLLLGQAAAGSADNHTVAFSTDSQYIATCNFNGDAVVSMFEARSLERVQKQPSQEGKGRVKLAYFAPNTHSLYYSFDYGPFMRMTPEGVERMEAPALETYASVLPVNEELFVASRYADYETPQEAPFRDGPISIAYHLPTGDVTELGKIGDSSVYHNLVLESGDGRWLAVGANLDTVNLYVFDRQRGKVVWSTGEMERAAAMVDFSTDGTRMLYGNRFESLNLYNTEKKFAITGTITATSGRDIRAAKLCLNDTAVLYAYGTTLVLVDIQTQRELQRYHTPHSKEILSIEVSPDGTQAVTASEVDLLVWQLGEQPGEGR